MRRSLTYYWRMHLAVAGGVAVTTAVLTGALLVGDSLRGSLRSLTLDRLGSIDVALLNNRFFPEDLADRLTERFGLQDGRRLAVPALLLNGSAIHSVSERRASGIQILGIDSRFLDLYPRSQGNPRFDFERRAGQVFASVVVNEPLMKELNLEVGEDLLLSFGRSTSVPTASLMGRREHRDLLTTLRVTVSDVVPASGAGRFGLEAKQNRPLNVYIDLSTLQRRLDRRQEVNLLLVTSPADAPSSGGSTATLDSALQDSLRLTDLGLQATTGAGYLAIESAELVLRPEIAEAVLEIADRSEIPTWSFLTYLANSMRVGDRLLPYSTVAALQTPIPQTLGTLETVAGLSIDELAEDQIALNTWAARDLEARPGQRLELSYYLVGSNDELSTATTTLEVGSIVEMRSLGADATLTPDVPGLSDTTDMSAWDPPFPVDLSLVRPEDEAYWDQYGATPKAFLPLVAGQTLWRSRFGELTSIRLAPKSEIDLNRLLEEFDALLSTEVSPQVAGFRWLSVREQGLRGASGTTDFAGLFVGFSLFLIVSAALLVGLLFTLLVEQRCREAGLLLATGYTVQAVRRRFLLEGGILAIVGALAGALLSLLYTQLILKGLAVWWAPIMDSPILHLYVEPTTLILGGLAAIILVFAVIHRSVRRISRIPARQLLAGSLARPGGNRSHGRAPVFAVIGLAAAAILLAASYYLGLDSAPALFFGIGACLLMAGIALYASWSQRKGLENSLTPTWVVPKLAARNSSRNLGRSLLCVTLVACASFVLVSVSASRKTHRDVTLSRNSGTGGFSLIAESDTPLPSTLSQTLRSRPVDSESVSAETFSFRLLPGDDASCLNLYQPEKPRLLGVPPSFVERGGFSFRGLVREVENPWTLLNEPFADGAIPAIGDYNSVRWILHSGLGQDVVIDDGSELPLRLRIVGLLQTSLFQSELLIAEEQFLRNFPDQAGYMVFLGEVPVDRLDATAEMLERELAPFGLDVEWAASRLAGFQAIENMYLTTFEVLGGLGLLLGTIGLGIVLLRNTLERRAELAVLRAFGYRRSTLARMVLAENAFLLALGLTIGSTAGLIAVGPYLWTGGIEVPWGSLFGILVAVLLVGLLASVAAVRGTLKVPLLPALKAE